MWRVFCNTCLVPVGKDMPGQFPGTTEPPLIEQITIRDRALTEAVERHRALPGQHEMIVQIKAD